MQDLGSDEALRSNALKIVVHFDCYVNLVFWNNGTHHNTVVDVSAFQKHSTDLMDYCISHSDMNLMDAIKNALGADK